MQRTIYVDVAGNRARASSRELGTQGEVAAVTVALRFDASWDGLAKRLLWRSANGASSGYTLLPSPDADGVCSVAAPALPLSEAGTALLTVEGVETSGGDVTRRARSAQLAFRVEPNDLEADSEAEAVDASVAEQLASAIEGKAAASHTHTKSDISDFSHSHAQSDVTGLASALSGKAAASHTHTKSNITDFSHTHTKSDITNFTHTHTKSEITDFAHTHDVDASDVTYDEDGDEISVATALDSLFEAADAPRIREYSGTLASNAWTGDSAPYTQTVSCAYVTLNSHVVVGVAESATDAQYEAACSACLRFSCASGGVTARAYGEKPSTAVPIKIGVIK